jgi:hypothetical protein
MQAFPKFETKVSRVIAWLTALVALALFAAPRAKAEDANTSRPPVSEAAIQATQSTTTASPAPAPAPVKTSTKSSKKSSKKSAPKPQAEAAPTPMSKEVSLTGSASTDSTGMTLRGGQERTDFKTMTIEGEDRVHVDVERPVLQLDLDAAKVHGLESGTAADVLNRVSPDLTTKYLALSATQPTPYLGRPWLRQFATGPVAKFQPNVKGVERWKLVVADSKGELVRTFEGKGDPPKEITWDGRTQNGKLVTPGLTYSYYMEAFDKAGNKRNFVGEGFKVSAYRADTPAGPVLVFSGMSVIASQKSSYGMGSALANRAVAPVILETVSWLNQSTRVQQPVMIAVSARSYEQANLIAKQVGMTMTDLALGDPSRIKAVAEVAPDAADGGVVRVSLAGADPTTGTAVNLSAPAGGKEKGKESKKDSKKSSKKDQNKK